MCVCVCVCMCMSVGGCVLYKCFMQYLVQACTKKICSNSNVTWHAVF